MSVAHFMSGLLLAATLLPSAAPRADEDAKKTDVTGRWTLTVQSDAGKQQLQLDLEQDGSKVDGTYSDAFGKADLSGSIEDDELELTMHVEVPKQELVVTFTATVQADTMQGTVKYGDLGSGKFNAVRK